MNNIVWSIKDSESIKLAPIHSWSITALRFIDGIIQYLRVFFDIPVLGGDLYEFSSKGLLKFILDKINSKSNEKYVEFRIIHIPMCLILSAELSKKILLSKYVKRGRIYNRLTDFFGFGIFTSNVHDTWFHQRKAIVKIFHKRYLDSIAPSLHRYMFDVLDRELLAYTEFDLSMLLSQMGLIAFCKIIFGVDISDNYKDLIIPLNRLLLYINGAVEPFVFPMDPLYQEFIKDKKIVHDWIRNLIKLADNPNCHPVIVEEFKNNHNQDDTELIEFISSLIFAGHETTAKLMTAIIYNMCCHPEYIEKLNSEYGRNNNHYLKNIIKEGTRLYPSAWILGREALQDFIIDDIEFHKGTQFIISPLIFLRSEEIWGPTAEEFIPDRFDLMTDSEKETFIPFVVGPESCPGKAFAELESAIVISNLFYHYKVEILEHNIQPASAVTFRLFDKLPVKINRLR